MASTHANEGLTWCVHARAGKRACCVLCHRFPVRHGVLPWIQVLPTACAGDSNPNSPPTRAGPGRCWSQSPDARH